MDRISNPESGAWSVAAYRKGLNPIIRFVSRGLNRNGISVASAVVMPPPLIGGALSDDAV